MKCEMKACADTCDDACTVLSSFVFGVDLCIVNRMEVNANEKILLNNMSSSPSIPSHHFFLELHPTFTSSISLLFIVEKCEMCFCRLMSGILIQKIPTFLLMLLNFKNFSDR